MIEWFFLTYVMGAIFVAGQVYEYAVLVSEGLTLASDAYGSAFYLTTGFHGLHVTGGLIAFLLVIGRAYAVKTSHIARRPARLWFRITGTSLTWCGLVCSSSFTY
jgi:heme/copper-type cytochrome/quinol oxidase subunit 3